MLHTKFSRNRTTGSWKEGFVSVCTIYEHCSHLGHVNRTRLMNFRFLVPKVYIQNLVENDPVVSENARFNVHM